jgi:hypothetical protein
MGIAGIGGDGRSGAALPGSLPAAEQKRPWARSSLSRAKGELHMEEGQPASFWKLRKSLHFEAMN